MTPQPTATEVTRMLVSQADKLAISPAELMEMARHGIVRLHEDEDGTLHWYIGELETLTWNSNQRRFVVPKIKLTDNEVKI